MNEAPLTNDAAARTETGELKDQNSTASSTTTEASSTEKPTTSTTAEAKPSGTETKPSLANEKPAETKPTSAQGAPEKYEAFKVPEGYEMAEETTKEVTGLFKELNLSQDAGQKLIDYYTTQTKEALDAPFKLWQETQEKWQNEVRLDSEIGGKLDQVKTTISKAIDGLGDSKLAADFRQAMDFTGAGNNLAFIKTFFKLASAVTEGGHVSGEGPTRASQARPGAAPPTAAHALYPNLP